MAILAKRVHPSGSGNFVSADGNIAATDLQYTIPDRLPADIVQLTVSRIESVIVYSGSATVDGKTFATGNWDFSKAGGIPLSGAPATTVAISGSCVVTVR